MRRSMGAAAMSADDDGRARGAQIVATMRHGWELIAAGNLAALCADELRDLVEEIVQALPRTDFVTAYLDAMAKHATRVRVP